MDDLLRILRFFAAIKYLGKSWLGLRIYSRKRIGFARGGWSGVSGETIAVVSWGLADGVAEETREGGEGCETELESDVRKAEIWILHVEDRLVGSVVFEVGPQTDIEMLAKDGSQVALRHVQVFRDVGNALQGIRMDGQETLYRVD